MRPRRPMKKVEFMTRKDSDKDAERPHYYSQFWLDIAAGRRTIGGPRPEDEGSESEDAAPVAAPAAAPAKKSSKEARPAPVAVAVAEEEDFELDQVADTDVPDFVEEEAEET